MENESNTLAPAAGAGIGKDVAGKLLDRADFVGKMEAAAMDGLTAMTARRWDPEAKKWIQDPDYKTRVHTFFGLLAQMEGEPVKRVIHEHVNKRVGRADMVQQLRDSPELLAAVEREIEKAKFHGLHLKAAEELPP